MKKRTSALKLLSSDRFNKAYYSASIPLQRLAEGAIRDLKNLHKSDPRTVLSQYDKAEQCRKANVMEIEISGGCRLLATLESEVLTMLDMGGHEVVNRYSDQKYELDIEQTGEAPLSFTGGSQLKIFERHPDESSLPYYKEELSAEWLYFLETEQNAIFEELTARLIDGAFHCSFVIGGPGTGKTCILLNILKFVSDLGFNVGISLSDNLAEFIESTTGFEISKYRVTASGPPELDILLVDDPTNLALKNCLYAYKNDNVSSAIIAFDPLQLDEHLPDKQFKKWVYDYDIDVYRLRASYRQKANIGHKTKRLVDQIAASTPFLADEKIRVFREDHKELTSLSNDLDFVNPHGYIEVYEESTVDDIQKEVYRILESKNQMWTHAPGLLILLDNCELSDGANDVLKKLVRRNYVRQLPLNRVNDIKGLEFQHVFIFIEKRNFDEIQNGFSGSGRTIYNERRLWRIPFSRAKDSLVTFAIENT